MWKIQIFDLSQLEVFDPEVNESGASFIFYLIVRMDSYKKLINEVKKNPILYDKYFEGYNDEAKKKIVWDAVGVATDMSGQLNYY